MPYLPKPPTHQSLQLPTKSISHATQCGSVQFKQRPVVGSATWFMHMVHQSRLPVAAEGGGLMVERPSSMRTATCVGSAVVQANLPLKAREKCTSFAMRNRHPSMRLVLPSPPLRFIEWNSPSQCRHLRSTSGAERMEGAAGKQSVKQVSTCYETVRTLGCFLTNQWRGWLETSIRQHCSTPHHNTPMPASERARGSPQGRHAPSTAP